MAGYEAVESLAEARTRIEAQGLQAQVQAIIAGERDRIDQPRRPGTVIP
jgi:hypothetical protein